jgi:hypothetical protein
MHATFINKRYFLNGFWTPLGLFSTWRFNEWILSIVSTLFSYCIKSHSTPNRTCPWNGLPRNHDQAFMWSSSHLNGGNIVSTHELHFMVSILWSFCNTFFPTPIWSCN